MNQKVNVLSKKVAVDVGPLTSGDSIRGIGVYTRELLNHLGINGVDIRKEDLSKFNVVHLTRFNPFFISIPFFKPKSTKFVLTIYDLIPIIYIKKYSPGLKGYLKWFINRFLIKLNVDAVITISETSKKDICRIININPDKVFVTYLAPRKIFKHMDVSKSTKSEILKKYKIPEKFALYVGDINYNKNINILVSACQEVGIPLVISGKQAANVEKINLDHAELVHIKKIDWTDCYRVGYVEDSELNVLYNMASVYIQPSLYEGFGLPVLEAMATGCPVVCSKTQTLIEIAGDAALYAKANEINEFASKIETILNNKNTRNLLIKNGYKVCSSYSWLKTAKDTLNVYEKI